MFCFLWQLKYIKTYCHQSHIRHCQANWGIHDCQFLALILITVILSTLEWPNASLLCVEPCAHHQPLYSWGVCWGLIEKGKLTHSRTLSVHARLKIIWGCKLAQWGVALTYATHLMAWVQSLKPHSGRTESSLEIVLWPPAITHICPISTHINNTTK